VTTSSGSTNVIWYQHSPISVDISHVVIALAVAMRRVRGDKLSIKALLAPPSVLPLYPT
jgi:hypothetical protein